MRLEEGGCIVKEGGCIVSKKEMKRILRFTQKSIPCLECQLSLLFEVKAHHLFVRLITCPSERAMAIFRV